MVQLQSFWNLIQTTDESIQKELYILFQRKYADVQSMTDALSDVQAPSFLQMKGILKGKGSEETDRQMLDDYLQEKYGV